MNLERENFTEVSYPTEEEILPVTGEFLVSLFENTKFIQALEENANKMREEGWEGGFEVYRAVRGEEIEIFELKPEESWDLRPSIEPITGEIYGKIMLVFSLHFHHPSAGLITPSAGFLSDLHTLATQRRVEWENGRGLEIRPVMAIGQVNEKKRVRMLCLQEQTIKPMPPALLKQIDSDLEEVKTQKEILDILRENGYRAEILTLASGYSLPESQKKKLRKFEFSPKIVTH